MSLIFNPAGLRDVQPPCVLQSFVNHGAVLHKVFVVGEDHFTVERPSLKNFPTGPHGQKTLHAISLSSVWTSFSYSDAVCSSPFDRETIFFNSH